MAHSIEEFHVGEKARFQQLITQEKLDKFVDLTGDDNPLHLSEEFAKNTPCKGRVVHGMLSASYVSTLVGKHLPGEGALWLAQSMEFLHPVRLGDTLTFEAEVTEIHPRQQILNLAIKVTNQHEQVVLSGTAKVRLAVSAKSSPKAKIQTKAVLVTGSGAGIGAETARVLAEKGFPLVLHYFRNEEGVTSLARELEANGREVMIAQSDLTKESSVQALLAKVKKRYGQLFGLVCAASPPMSEKGLLETGWTEFETQLEGQLKSAILCIQAALPLMLENKGGSIVIVGSQAAISHPPAKWLAYAVAKHALHGLTPSLVRELGPKGIRINTVAPGMVDTRFIRHVPEKARLLAEQRTPLRKIAKPHEVAETIAFLLSDSASHITGVTLPVDGGGTE